MRGTETVNAFTLDPNGQPDHVSIDFSEYCRAPSQSDTSGTITGHLRYQDRADTTAPARPTRLTIDGGVVRWRNSGARDLRTTIVRVVTGGRSTPTSGYPLSAGNSTSAKLPTSLRHGSTYRVAAFSVDRTGNVSSATTKTFVY